MYTNLPVVQVVTQTLSFKC